MIRAYQDACSGAVARYDGFVAKFMGDGVLAYFGFPRAHEDDAERAVRAGLDIVDAVAQARDAGEGVALKVRVGIATGLVVVGEIVGEGQAQEQAVVGETPNLAARLQALAEPGSVVVAESTRRLLGGAFELEGAGAAGAQRLRRAGSRLDGLARGGERQPLRGVAVRGDDAFCRPRARSRAAASTAGATRARARARSCCSRARRASASRAFWLRCASASPASAHVSVRYQCSPHHVNDAFYPIVEPNLACGGIRKRRAGGGAARQAGSDDRALGARQRRRSRPISPRCCRSLSEGRYPPIEMAPSEQKERTIAALIALFAGLTQGRPGAGAAGRRALDRPDLARRVQPARSIDCLTCARCW